MRGEHAVAARGNSSNGGSSPHARGTLRRQQGRADHARFIPACAGNTLGELKQQDDGAVHPRMRGEHHRLRAHHDYAIGSSPHARGTPSPGFQNQRGQRFIPACAGNTPRVGRRGSRDMVHPRMRGEHHRPGHLIREGDGSSPHARGTHCRSCIHRG